MGPRTRTVVCLGGYWVVAVLLLCLLGKLWGDVALIAGIFFLAPTQPAVGKWLAQRNEVVR
jgi:hypothetical protein